LLWLMLLVCAPGPTAAAAPQQAPTYTMAEYNAYQAAANEKNAQQRIALLEDFVAKYPKSTLLPYVYRNYYLTYYELKNYPKTVEYVDKQLASSGDKLDNLSHLEALTARAQAFFLGSNQKALNTPEQLNKARAAAAEGLTVLGQWTKPDTMNDQQYAQQKKSLTVLFNSIAGITSTQLKDYKAAVDSFKEALAVDPTDALNNYRLGVAYLQQEPAQYMDGFWALARAINLKVPGETQVRDYLRKQMLRYQQTGCDKLLNDQMNELIGLAANSAERPATYKIPSGAELQKAREETTNFIVDLKAGGDKAKLLWLAVCGLEFPEVGGKVIEAPSSSDSVVLKLFFAPTEQEIEAGTVPNMEVKVEGQPEVKRLQAGDGVRFSGTLVGYDPEPFMLHWEKAKVNPEDIPAEKGQPAKKHPPAKRPPAKKPGG
jgi:tetratricopeptide (TPR) repeat protein